MENVGAEVDSLLAETTVAPPSLFLRISCEGVSSVEPNLLELLTIDGASVVELLLIGFLES